MANKITKDCYVNVKGWTEKEVLEAAEIFAENVEGANVDPGWLGVNDSGYEYLFMLSDGDMFVGSVSDATYHKRVYELSKEDFFPASSSKSREVSDVDICALVDKISHYKENYDSTTTEIEKLKEEAESHKQDYLAAIEQLQNSVAGFKIEPIIDIAEDSSPSAANDIVLGSVWTYIEMDDAGMTQDKEYAVREVTQDHVSFYDDDGDPRWWGVGHFLAEFKKSVV